MEEIKIKEEIVTDQSLFAYEIKKEFCKSEQQVNDNLDYYSLQLKSENPDVKYGICHDELLIKSEDDNTTTNQPWAPHDYQSLNQNHVQQLIKTDSVENLGRIKTNLNKVNAKSEPKCIECGACGYNCICRNPLSSKIPEKPFECNVCEYKCKAKCNLKIHLLTHTGEKRFKCTTCEYKCYTHGDLERHILTHTGVKPYECSMCEYKCSMKSNLNIHLLTHTGEKPFECTVCMYKCIVKSSLKRHLLTHTGEKPFECTICDYKCAVKSTLNTHIRTHTGEKPFKCHVCNYTCKQRGHLQKHLLTHTGEKPFECSVCKYKCFTKSSLNRHLLIHSGEKPIKCHLCNYTCKLKGHLKTHLLTHSGVKPFECTECDYKCSLSSSLRRHILTHTGEKPFECNLCDFKCSMKSHLKRHLFTHTAYFDEGMQVDQTESESSDEESFITETESFQYTTNSEHVTSESTGSEKDAFTSNVEKLQTERVEHVLESINKTAEFRNVPSTDAQQNNAFQKINIQGNYSKKPWTRERPTICPICHKDVITHFTRHLFKHHKDNEQVIKIKILPPKSKERLALVSALRKQGYFHLKTEKNILSPVRTSKTPNTKYFVCIYCLGHYSKSLLYKHVKICKQKPTSEIDPGKNCLTKSQTFLATMTSKDQNFLKSTRIKDEVFGIMRADEISLIAKSDALICLFGEALLNKHKRQQIFTVISNKMREMGRLLIALRLINDSIDVLFDALKPERFQDLISATKEISGYDPVSKCYKSPSLALHMGTNLKVACDIALEIVLENRNLPKIQWENGDLKKQEIEDTKELIERHWCAKISSIALKVLKERQWEKPNSLTNDIQAFQTYVNNLASESYDNIVNKRDVLTNYTVLTECVLALTIMFNRKCVGDIQCLKITTYNKNWDTTSFIELLTNVEKIISQKCKIVLTYDKGLQPLLILFPSQIQKYITLMLEVRKHLGKVLKSNPFLFSNSRSANKYIAAYHAIKKLAPNCGVKNPSFLTSTKFKKRIATTLQLLAMNENELEQVATLMGHTEETHTEFYRLPEDIYQTAKVAKVLMLLEKGKGNQFKAKSLNEIDFDNDVYCSSESDNEDTCCKQFHRPNIESRETDEPEPGPSQIEHPRCVEPKPMKSGRVRWTEAEKRIVKSHFKSHIENKITPKKDECNKLLVKHANIFMNKDWARVKIFVYNVFRDK